MGFNSGFKGLITYVRYGDEGKIEEGIVNLLDQKYLDNC